MYHLDVVINTKDLEIVRELIPITARYVIDDFKNTICTKLIIYFNSDESLNKFKKLVCKYCIT